MCGIAGIFGDRPDSTTIDAMLDLTRHRGPDDRGLTELEGAVLGQNRLSIIDLAGGHQPMATPDGQAWITYNGELYNFPALREELGPERFRTRSDTEVILQAYLTWGPDAVKRFDGMFAFAIWHAGRYFFARDPFGKKPLYYGRTPGGRLAFASEIRALLGVVERIREFPAGHYLQPDTGLVRYYHLPGAECPSLEEAGDLDAAVDELRRRLRAAVRKRLIADVPLGVFLSGGLDSSITSALAREAVDGKLHSFSVGVEGSSDLEFSREVARALGTTHHAEAYTAEDVIRALPKVIYHLESFDPALVRSAIPTYFVSRMARRHVKVVLSGEGADELFAGYHYLKEIPDRAALHQELRDITLELHYLNVQRVDRMTMAVSLEGRCPFLDLRLAELAFQIPPEWKVRAPKRTEKWILRRAAEAFLPTPVVWRKKEKFAVGTGTGDILEAYADRTISRAEFERERTLPGGFRLLSKEELLYYRIFRQTFPAEVAGLIGRSRSLAPGVRYA